MSEHDSTSIYAESDRARALACDALTALETSAIRAERARVLAIIDAAIKTRELGEEHGRTTRNENLVTCSKAERAALEDIQEKVRAR